VKTKAVSKFQRKSSIVPQPIIEKRPFIPDPPMLPSDAEDAELTETELDDQESVLPSSTTTSELGDGEIDDDDGEAYSSTYEDDDWEPPTKTPKAKQPHSTVPLPSFADHTQLKGHSQAVPKSFNNQLRVAKLTKDMDNLDISEDSGAGSSVILSEKAYRKAEPLNVHDEDEDEEFDLPVVKKKKRSVILQVVSNFYTNIAHLYSQLGKNPVINEEGINKMAYAVETSVPKTIRRFVK
jgi:kinesin family protein 20